MEFTISLPKDDDGYLTQECPVCRRRFKIAFGQGSKGKVAHCPYGGHGANTWWTPEQERYISEAASEKVLDPMLKGFADRVNRSGAGGLLRVSAEVRKGPRATAPAESNESMAITTFSCCGETIKYEGTEQRLYCVICGTLTPVG